MIAYIVFWVVIAFNLLIIVGAIVSYILNNKSNNR